MAIWLTSLRYVYIFVKTSFGMPCDLSGGAMGPMIRTNRAACPYDCDHNSMEADRSSMKTVGASRWQHKMNPLIALKLCNKKICGHDPHSPASSSTECSGDIARDTARDTDEIDFFQLRNVDSVLQGSYKVRVSKMPAPRPKVIPPSGSWQELDSSFVDGRGIHKKLEFAVQHEEIDWVNGVNEVGRFRIKNIASP
ncbi:hypothetical protein AAP_00306 [Ascosphaera apis ARSEF 7405]|uniref:Uncharacterized protein n=1 Tax=Ascosphaera apis ARSEF 7405 TaxID=392613 RepID=A0A168DS07_9EURO|nr:hypothetical protein AAP_00306 [Ascosphaera apis ARSEF 7405]